MARGIQQAIVVIEAILEEYPVVLLKSLADAFCNKIIGRYQGNAASSRITRLYSTNISQVAIYSLRHNKPFNSTVQRTKQFDDVFALIIINFKLEGSGRIEDSFRIKGCQLPANNGPSSPTSLS